MLSKNLEISSRLEEWRLRKSLPHNSATWQLKPWVNVFPDKTEFLTQLHMQNLGSIDRTLIKSIVRNSFLTSNVVDGFLATMIWGYSNNSTGPYRTSKIINQKDFESNVSNSYDYLLKSNTKKAFDTLITNGPKYLGPAFGTKYLYFAAPKSLLPAPVILDSLISEALATWGNFHIDSQKASSNDYLEYINYMAQEAENLGMDSECLEMIMFTEQSKLKENSSWSNRQSRIMLTEREKWAWGLMLAGEILLIDESLFLSYEEPGGGQYRNLVLRKKDQSSEYVIHINLNGSIQIHSRKSFSFDWLDLYSQGASLAAKLITKYLGITDREVRNANIHARCIRKLASLMVDNLRNKDFFLKPVIADNSVYGISMAQEFEALLSEYKVSYQGHPSYWSKPPENWLWIFKLDESEQILLDSHTGVSINSKGSKSNFLQI